MKSILAVAVGIALCAGLWGAQDSRSPEVRLKAAIHAEEVVGDLKGAIDQYKKLANGSNRAVAANALIRMGECYEKLGDAEARKTYERVLSAFQDQKDTVALARSHLAALEAATPKAAASATSEFRLRRIGSGNWVGEDGEVSPNGRYQSFTDDTTDDLAIHDLVTGTERKLTDKIRTMKTDYPNNEGRWSPDGKSIAFTWKNGKTGNLELHVMKVENKEDRIIPVAGRLIDVFQWTQDGKSLLIDINHLPVTRPAPTIFALLDFNTGKLDEFLTLNAGRPSARSRMSPDSHFMAFEAGEGQRDIFCYSLNGKQETALVTNPATDYLLDWTPDGKAILFTSDRSGKEDMWAQRVSEGKPLGEPILIKPDIGPILPLGFSTDGSYFWAFGSQTSRNIYSVELDSQTGKMLAPAKRISLAHEGSNGNPVISPDGKAIAYVSSSKPTESALEGDLISVYYFENQARKEFPVNHRIFLIGLNQPQWLPDNQTILFSRNEPQIQSLESLDVRTGIVKVVLDKGWQGYYLASSPDGKRAYTVPIQGANGGKIMAIDLESQKATEIFSTPDSTGVPRFHRVPFSPDGKYLVVQTAVRSPIEGRKSSDKYWLVSTGGGEPRVLFLNEDPDLFTRVLCWTADSNYVLLNQSKDRGSVLDTYNPGSELIKVPLHGGPVTRFALQVEGNIDDVSPHPDGKRFALTLRNNREKEIWVMENFLSILKSK